MDAMPLPLFAMLAVASLTILTIYTIIVIIYRLTLHPLAKYPGPIFAKITSWYDTYHSYKGDRHLDQHGCHQKYGAVVRYGPNCIIVNTAGGLRDIYSGSKNAPIKKGPMYRYLHDQGGQISSTHSTINKDSHARKRRVLSHAFSENSMKAMESYVIKNVETCCDILSEKDEAGTDWSSAKNMSTWMNYAAFDVLGDLCFGQPFGLLTSAAHRYIPQLILLRSASFHTLGNSPLVQWWTLIHDKPALDKLAAPNTYREIDKYRHFARGAMKERVALAELEKAEGTQARKDFFYWLTEARDPTTGEGYSSSELWLEAMLLITAGSDTTATTLAAAFHFLTKNPAALDKLQEELRSTFANVEEIHSPQVNHCQYLRAVIDETLRLAPPVPSSLQRETTEDVTIDGHSVPKGTFVGTAAWSVHRNPDYYRKPNKFWPERWIANDPTGVSAEELELQKSAFCPFSLGSRGCIGKPMAYAELTIMLGRALFRFDIKREEDKRIGQAEMGDFVMKDRFVCERHGPYIQFKEAAISRT